jgi:hypothetical protein
MTPCPCKGSGVVLVEGPCDAAPLEAPCPCLGGGFRASPAGEFSPASTPAPLNTASSDRSGVER